MGHLGMSHFFSVVSDVAIAISSSERPDQRLTTEGVLHVERERMDATGLVQSSGVGV